MCFVVIIDQSVKKYFGILIVRKVVLSRIAKFKNEFRHFKKYHRHIKKPDIFIKFFNKKLNRFRSENLIELLITVSSLDRLVEVVIEYSKQYSKPCNECIIDPSICDDVKKIIIEYRLCESMDKIICQEKNIKISKGTAWYVVLNICDNAVNAHRLTIQDEIYRWI